MTDLSPERVERHLRAYVVLAISIGLIAYLAVLAFGMAEPAFIVDEGPGFVVLWLILGLLPGLIVLQHALLLALDVEPEISPVNSDASQLRDIMPVLVTEIKRYRLSRSPLVLLTRFGLPTLCTIVAALVILPFVILGNPTKDEVRLFLPNVINGVRWGGLGAYVYVLLHLSQRYFQRDVTTGGVLWCAVNLVLGPIIAGAIAFLVGEGASKDRALQFQEAGVYFLAGLAPRYLADRISEFARTLILQKTGKGAFVTRILPLAQLRGITPVIEDRLFEEGINDVYGLAMANPFRLLRRTPYDKRQIASWIDEALLMMYVPQGSQLLEQVGITGAIDLAALGMKTFQEARGAAVPTAADHSRTGAPLVPTNKIDIPANLAELAKIVKIEPSLFVDLIRRIAEDTQVQLVWGLYQFVATDDGRSLRPDRGAADSPD
jgi:hypothetical protein